MDRTADSSRGTTDAVEGANAPQAAQHPIWAPGVSKAIQREYREVCEQRDQYQSRHARADSEAERYQFALEEIVLAVQQGLGNAAVERIAQAALGPLPHAAGESTAPAANVREPISQKAGLGDTERKGEG